MIVLLITITSLLSNHNHTMRIPFDSREVCVEAGARMSRTFDQDLGSLVYHCVDASEAR